MARPEMESSVDNRNPVAPQSCRMVVLRQDAWPSGSIVPPCHRRRTVATQTSTVSAPLPLIPTLDAFSSDNVQEQDNSLRDNTGTEQEVSRPRDGQLPLADLLPDNQSPPEDSGGQNNPRLEERAVERLAIQLRTIGDEMNAFLLQRNAVPPWQNWGAVYHWLTAFIADTINTLYQHRLR